MKFKETKKISLYLTRKEIKNLFEVADLLASIRVEIARKGIIGGRCDTIQIRSAETTIRTLINDSILEDEHE